MKIKVNSKNLKILGINFKDKEKDAKKFMKSLKTLTIFWQKIMMVELQLILVFMEFRRVF